jgi:hypothetical protein
MSAKRVMLRLAIARRCMVWFLLLQISNRGGPVTRVIISCLRPAVKRLDDKPTNTQHLTFDLVQI